MKRALLIIIVMLTAICGCISDERNEPPTIQSFIPESTSMEIEPYTSVNFLIDPLDPNEDNFTIRWYVDDTYEGDGTSLDHFFSGEGAYEVRCVLDDGEYNVPHIWHIDVNMDLDAIKSAVSDLRSLEFTTDVPFRTITRLELSDLLEDDFKSSDEDLLVTQRLLSAFHVWDNDKPLQEQVLEFYTSGGDGFYDLEEKEFILVDEESKNTVARMVTIAHELTHVLQDQNYAITERLETDNDDELLAFTSLLEGDATLMEYTYLYSLDPGALDDYIDYIQSIDDINVEQIISDIIMFPYIYGFEFVADLVEKNGRDYLDEVFKAPPTSTEQVMHPEKYTSGEGYMQVELPEVQDMALVDENVLGEGSLFIILDQHLDTDSAKRAAEGWNGDSYALYEKGDAELLVFRIAWDSKDDLEEFLELYIESMSSWENIPQIISEGPAQYFLESEEDAILIEWDENTVTVMTSNDVNTLSDFI